MSHSVAGESRLPALPVIAGTWGLCGVVHLLTFPWISLSAWDGVFYAVATLALLLRPSSAVRFGVFLSATFSLLLLNYESLSNHLVLEFWISLTILSVLVFKAQEIGAERCGLKRVYQIVGPLVRTQYLLLYLFAILSKLNTDFLRADVSCAALFAKRLIETFHLPIPDTPLIAEFAIYLTLAAELAIPLLLISSRTRRIGILVAYAFHFLMGFIPILGISSFSSLSFVLLLFFLPEETIKELSQQILRLEAKLRSNRKTKAIHGLLFVGVTLALVAVHRHFLHPSPILTNAVWLALSAPLIWLILNSLRKTVISKGSVGEYFVPRPTRYIALAAPVAMIGLLPYLGLQTQGSFTMFSNLRILGENPNHLFASQNWHLGEPRLVRIVGTNHPELLSFPESNLLVTAHEIRRKTANTPQDFYLLCEYDEEIRLIGRFQGKLTPHPLLEPLQPGLLRLLRFRDVSTAEFCGCAW